MHLFNARGQIQRYESPSHIVDDFCTARRAGYARRRAHLLGLLAEEASVLRNRALFIELVVCGRLKLHAERGGAKDDDGGAGDGTGVTDVGVDVGVDVDVDVGTSTAAEAGARAEGDPALWHEMTALGLAMLGVGGERPSFAYLLSMPMSSMTPRRKRALEASLGVKEAQLARVEATTPDAMWLADLDAFEREYASLFPEP
jgi:DNA topoisomerase-2